MNSAQTLWRSSRRTSDKHNLAGNVSLTDGSTHQMNQTRLTRQLETQQPNGVDGNGSNCINKP